MCGIAGYVDFREQPQRFFVSKMLNSIFHRGPDQKGVYIEKHVGMGIQRLSIIDLNSGNQPIYNEDKSVAVVFNGEIYNYLELKNLLEKKGHKFKTKSDTETLVHLYESFGYNMSQYLRGMFAFAVWDKNNELIFVGRDQTGIKPLYYWQKGRTLIFASEIKPILLSPQVKKSINPEALKTYSSLGYIPGNLSIFENIHKLLPGHNLVFSKEGKKIKTFYKLNPGESNSSENIDTLLEKAVISHSMSDVPLGVLLSGGVDSSLIAYYLTKNIRKKINTFSINFEDKSFDESKFARIVAKHLGTKHHYETFSPRDVLDLFPIITQKLDEPLADPSLFPTFKVSALARKYVKVVLSGDGGDELFGGYPTYQGHLLAEHVKKILPQSAGKLALNILNLVPSSLENYPKVEVGKEFLKGIHSPAIKRHLLWMSLKNYHPGILNKSIFSNSVKLNYLSNLIREIEKKPVDMLTKMRLFDYETYLKDDLLVKVDRASMLNSLEVRVPFLDQDVLEKAFSLNSHVDIFTTKKILRALLKEKFPPEIFNRGKKGFGMPIAKWITSDLEDLAGEHLHNPRLYEYFDKKMVQQLWQNHLGRKQENSKLIWMIVMFSGWLNEWF